MNKGLFALALGTFALGITEYTMMGILGTLASDLNITISEAGHLISAYATGVCIGAPALLFARKLPLKLIMMILAAMIVVGNLLTAVSPTFWTMFASRFLAGLPHGAYFGVGAIVARRLARPGHEVSAVSFMIAGMTVATLGGVPLATFITEAVSWRAAFWIVVTAGLAAFIAIKIWVPRVPGLPDRGFKDQFHFLKTLPPWLIFGGVIFGQIGFYCWYSYIEPQMIHVAGFPISAMSWIMILAGVGMFAGNLIAGQLSDHYKPAFIAYAVQASGIAVLVAFFFLASYQLAAVLLMMLGTAALFGSGSPLQSSIVGYSKGGEMLGGACIQIAYNAGNAIAAWIGGQVIAAGYGYNATSIVGTPITFVGCILLYILYRRYERTPRVTK